MANKYETDSWPVIQARWFEKSQGHRNVRLVVIHTMEAPEKDPTAENVARYFQNLPPNKKASAHLCIDNNSIVQCVYDNDVAYAAPGANRDGIQLELAGYSAQTAAEWDDDYSRALLENAANAAAQYCLKYGVPVKHLTNDELRFGRSGIIGHKQASDVYHLSNHGDPGGNFPWDRFIAATDEFYQQRKARLDA